MYNSDKTALLIKNTAKEKGKNLGEMLQSCGLNRDAISLMSRRGSWLQSNNLAKIADYLDCSVDYLLGRTDNPQAHKLQNLYKISNYDTIVNGTQANVITNELMDNETMEIVQIIKSLPIVKRAEAILAIEEIKHRE